LTPYRTSHMAGDIERDINHRIWLWGIKWRHAYGILCDRNI